MRAGVVTGIPRWTVVSSGGSAIRRALIASLPATAPAEAQPYLRRAFAAQAETTVALGRGLRSVREEAVRLEHGRGAVAAYLPSAPRVARVAATG